MGFWSDTWQKYWNGAGATPNNTVSVPDSVGPTYRPGDPHGLEIVDDDVAPQNRMTAFVPSLWDGWPAEWSSPQWNQLGPKFDTLVDTAWAALDLNASVLSSMPLYRVKDGKVKPPATWMINPDPNIYTGWPEFAKQLFWDFQMGEAFVYRMASAADGWPYAFRVVPQWLMNVEMVAGQRRYNIGDLDVTDDILHIRYKSSTDSARGIGPLESGGARMVTAGVLAKYASEIAQGGGIPKYILETEQDLTPEEADHIKDQWWSSRMQDLTTPWKPAIAYKGLKANPLQLDPQKMALMELSQYAESRITNLLGVPAFLLGLASGDPMTYTNASGLFSFHDRRYLKTAAVHVMSALSGWALPRGQSVELNRDEYSRPGLKERVEAYEKLVAMGVLSREEIRVMERFVDAGDGPTPEESSEDLVAAEALTGGGLS